MFNLFKNVFESMKKKCLVLCVAALCGIMFFACKDKEKEDEGKKKIDPSTIAADNLVAYFAFEGNGNDAISEMTPKNASTTTVTFPEGRRGKCFQGSNDGLKSGLLYELQESSKLKSLKTFSISLWAKLVPNTKETTEAPEQMLFQVNGTGDWVWGNLFLLQQRNLPESEKVREKNFAPMTCYFWGDDAKDWKGQRGDGWYLDVTVSNWRHIICTYNNATSEFHAYVNGVHVKGLDEDGKPEDYKGVNRTQGENGPPFGDLKFKEAKFLAIGAWCERLRGESLLTADWASPFKGQLDEFRIYDKALTAKEVEDLYAAEVSQLDLEE